MLRGIELKSRTLFGTHRNLTCQMRMTCRTLIGALRKRTYQLRLTINLILYSARTETHMSSKIDSSLVLYSARTESDMLSKIDLKSRTLLGLGTDIRFVYFLSYFKNISLGRMNSSLVLDSTLGCSSFLYCYCYSSAYLTAAND